MDPPPAKVAAEPLASVTRDKLPSKEEEHFLLQVPDDGSERKRSSESSSCMSRQVITLVQHVLAPTAATGVLCRCLELHAPFATFAALLQLLPAAYILRQGVVLEWQHRTQRPDAQQALERLPTNAYLQQLHMWYFLAFFACCVSATAVLLLMAGREQAPPQMPCSAQLSQLFVLMLAWAAAMLTWAYKRAYDNPKSLRALLRLLFSGCGKDELMISYCWGEAQALAGAPRALAQILPPHATWIDVRRLQPGDVRDVCEATAVAARDARLRFVFLSAAYMRSAACQVELREILRAPREEVLFIPLETGFRFEDYPESFGGGALDLELLTTDAIEPTKLSAAWLLQQLVRTGVMRTFLRRHTPAIYERWRETAEAVLGRVDLWSVLVRRVPSFSLSVLGIVGFAAHLQLCAGSTDLRLASALLLNATATVLTAVTLVHASPLSLYAVNASSQLHGDVVWLLLLLVHLELVPNKVCAPRGACSTHVLVPLHAPGVDTRACTRNTGAPARIGERAVHAPRRALAAQSLRRAGAGWLGRGGPAPDRARPRPARGLRRGRPRSGAAQRQQCGAAVHAPRVCGALRQWRGRDARLGAGGAHLDRGCAHGGRAVHAPAPRPPQLPRHGHRGGLGHARRRGRRFFRSRLLAADARRRRDGGGRLPGGSVGRRLRRVGLHGQSARAAAVRAARSGRRAAMDFQPDALAARGGSARPPLRRGARVRPRRIARGALLHAAPPWLSDGVGDVSMAGMSVMI